MAFIENQPWGSTSYTILPGSHITFQTSRAKVDLLTNPYFGRMLFIDNVLQSTTSDEHIYHRTLVKEGMGYIPSPRVLIVGGAEGATLREVQNHNASINLGVKEIVMVDWDEELVKHMDSNEPWSQGSFDDERLTFIGQDIHQYLDSNPQPFDTIILDLLDPKSGAEVNWLVNVIERCKRVCVNGGRMIVNCGSLAESDWVDKFATREMKKIVLQVPSFMEPWVLLFIQN